MKVLLLNGSPHEHGCTYTALMECADALHAEGIETHLHWVGNKPVAGCIACASCRTNGKCFVDDGVNEIAAMVDELDGIIVGSPVYYAGPSGQVCSFLDRLFYSCGKRMAGKAAAAVVSCRRGGASAAFDRLNKYFTISKMFVVGSQYWNSVHGNRPEETRQDLEGLQIMRTLGKNMAWFLKMRQGKELPEYEPGVATNFIR
ncbi:MAG: flavodoxin family protein [Oscillospiraceae bacterium]|nr:flavodoxin family protein [Oscillospiraceae bacterium]